MNLKLHGGGGLGLIDIIRLNEYFASCFFKLKIPTLCFFKLKHCMNNRHIQFHPQEKPTLPIPPHSPLDKGAMSSSHRSLASPLPPIPQPSQSQPPGSGPFIFPHKHDAYPPFFSLQPTLLTRHAQLKTWSRLIQSYCRHQRIFKLVLATALDTPLFHNAALRKRMSLAHVKEVVQFMAGEEGGRRAEWIGGDWVSCWVFWRRPEEWAEVLAGWVS